MTSHTEIRLITAGETLRLRREILRPDRPIQDSVYVSDDELDTQHWGAFVDNALIAIASLYREELPEFIEPESMKQTEDAGNQQAPSIGQSWRLRGMAVQPDFQGKGYGSRLLKRCLQSVAHNDGRLLWCNARSSAVGFYEGLRFQITGSEFEIPGVGAHFVMLCCF